MGVRSASKALARLPNQPIVIFTTANVAWIKEVASLPGGALNVRLKDGKGTDLAVARDRARAFKRRLGL